MNNLKATKRETVTNGQLKKLRENGFSFCPEITTKISMLNINIEEFPINYIGRTYEQGKKITAFDGLDALYVLAKYRYFK